MSSEYRTTLSAPSRELHDPRNLPYEAIRRAWWNGVWACILWVIVIGGVVLVVVLIVVNPDDGAAGPASYGRPSRGPTPARASSADSTEKPPGAELPPAGAGDAPVAKAQGRFGPRLDPIKEQRLNPLSPKTLPPNTSIR